MSAFPSESASEGRMHFAEAVAIDQPQPSAFGRVDQRSRGHWVELRLDVLAAAGRDEASALC